MPRMDKRPYNKHEHKQDHKHEPDPEMEITEEEEKWNPTPEAFQAFLVRDEELATSNVHLVMSARKFPMNLKEIKGSTLHSTDVIERVLLKGIADGTVQESKGEYSLVNVRNS